MMYLLVFSVLLVAMHLYFRVADYYNIIDKPNSRSSHTQITIRGGGIIFPFALALYALFFQEINFALLGGMLLISMVSFWDDVSSLSNKVRLAVHLLSVSALLWSVGAFDLWSLWLVPMVYILIIGTINAYNFMDGINGMTGLYSLVILGSLLYINKELVHFTQESFIVCAMLACLVFLFFNFRKKAKCFAGDVGSVSLGFWVIALLLMLLTETASLEYILFLAVYGVDAVLTIVHRLILKQNIFKAHRLHFYQLLANEQKVSHLIVSSLYGGAQMLINIFVIATDYNFFISSLLVLTPLSMVYVVLKIKWMPKVVKVSVIKKGTN